jgi:hypothetical protein
MYTECETDASPYSRVFCTYMQFVRGGKSVLPTMSVEINQPGLQILARA